MLEILRKDFFCKLCDIFDIERVCGGSPTNSLRNFFVLNQRKDTSSIYTSLEINIGIWSLLPFLPLFLLISAYIQLLLYQNAPKKDIID